MATAICVFSCSFRTAFLFHNNSLKVEIYAVMNSWVILGCIHQTGIRCVSHSEMSVRKIGSKQKVKLSRASWPPELSGPEAPLNLVIAESHFGVWQRMSRCQSSACGAEWGKGASPLCFMQMKLRWLSAMQQPMPINSLCVKLYSYISPMFCVLFVCINVACTLFASVCAHECVYKFH